MHSHRSNSSDTSKFTCIALVVLAAQSSLARAQDVGLEQAADLQQVITSAKFFDEIAVELTNPMGSLSAVFNDFKYETFQGNLNGASDQTRLTYLITPSIPFLLNNGKSIVLRTTFPVTFGEPTIPFQIDQDYADWRIRQFANFLPLDTPMRQDHSYLGDISVDLAYGGVSDNGYITMFGAAAVLATSQDGSSERDQYLLGPEFAFGKVTRWGVIGAWLTHLTNVAAADEKLPLYDTNLTSLKIFFAYGLGNGWQIISNPVIEYDREGLKDNRLLLPIGGGFSKTTSIGRMPLKMDLELFHYVESPTAFGPEWLLTFSVTPVLSDRSR